MALFISKGEKLVLNSFKLILLCTTLIAGNLQAQNDVVQEMNKDYLTITSSSVSLVQQDLFNQEYSLVLDEAVMRPEDMQGMPNALGLVSVANVGQVLFIAQGLVGLGEGVYNLAQKGKPSNTTEYAPISVLPKLGNDYVEIMDTEDWKSPKKYTYVLNYKNYWNMNVVSFRYSVIYSYGGTYNGKGAYITAAQIIPERVMTMFGFDFTATMKLSGVQNHGSRENPVAGAILTIQHTVSSVISSILKTESYHITGQGALKQLNR